MDFFEDIKSCVSLEESLGEELKILKVQRDLWDSTNSPRTSVSCPNSSCHSWRDLRNEGFEFDRLPI
jgi:hypothetical protein